VLAGRPGKIMQDGFLEPRHYANKINRRFISEDFSVRPMFSKTDGNGAATGATGDVNLMRTNRGQYEWHVKGAGQTILVPAYDATTGKGLDFAQDQASTEGHELAFSPNIVTSGGDRGAGAYKVGTDDAFFARLQILSSDWSGVGTLFFGVRKPQAYATALATYTDYAGFKVVNSGALGAVKIETNLAGAGAVLVDTTQTIADNVAAVFEIRVKKDGTVFFRFNDGAPTVGVSGFVFAAGTILIPVSFFLHSADLADNLWYQQFDTAYLPQKAA